mmetsp:Transcript_1088/g.2372  ORF Transcript_1088/g.2372 Transcript_1088/m.2372 type:complete len:111 (+) Transcript_1088:2248-2580(+)
MTSILHPQAMLLMTSRKRFEEACKLFENEHSWQVRNRIIVSDALVILSISGHLCRMTEFLASWRHMVVSPNVGCLYLPDKSACASLSFTLRADRTARLIMPTCRGLFCHA